MRYNILKLSQSNLSENVSHITEKRIKCANTLYVVLYRLSGGTVRYLSKT